MELFTVSLGDSRKIKYPQLIWPHLLNENLSVATVMKVSSR